MNRDLGDRRESYDRDSLLESHAPFDPFVLFGAWLDAALASQEREPYAMCVATADAEGNPSARIVLLRGWDERGLTFFTHYRSRKGMELAKRPRAALVFAWPSLERQVRIEGAVEVLAREESDAYFARRPRGHQVSAWASPQSTVIADRDVLEAAMRDEDRQFPPGPVPRPSDWGGFRVCPEQFEFWQGRRNRVHDRLRFTRNTSGWLRERLAP
jgi:pyridoxamine 5'-phosphate oxidase